MKPKPRKITLGESSFTIRPFTLSELADLDAVMDSNAGGNAKKSTAILQIAIQRDNPGFDAGSIVATWPELNVATRHVLEMAGYVNETDATSGEARAAENDAESTSAISTAA